MSISRIRRQQEELNPYIALSDLCISVILIIIFFVALGRLGLANNRYRKQMNAFNEAVQKDLPPAMRPRWDQGRNDPPGVQRWIFDGRTIFEPADPRQPNALPRLSQTGARMFAKFGKLLSRSRTEWRRIRVEGHTKPPDDNMPDDWDLSSRRAAVAVRELQTSGHISPWFFAVAGRAGQNPLWSVYVYTRSRDNVTLQLEHTLRTSGITYSEKPIPANATKDPILAAVTPLLSSYPPPYLIQADINGKSRNVSIYNSFGMNKLVNDFGQNERVEVLIEYTARGTSSTRISTATN